MIDTLRNILLRDFWLKLFSLMLAVLIWLAVSSAIHRDVSPSAALDGVNAMELTFSNVPVLVMSTAADVRNFNVNPRQVQVKVRGDAKSLQMLQVSDLHALVDLTGIEAARGLKKKIAVTAPANITYVSTTPEEVEVIVPPKR